MSDDGPTALVLAKRSPRCEPWEIPLCSSLGSRHAAPVISRRALPSRKGGKPSGGTTTTSARLFRNMDGQQAKVGASLTMTSNDLRSKRSCTRPRTMVPFEAVRRQVKGNASEPQATESSWWNLILCSTATGRMSLRFTVSFTVPAILITFYDVL